MKSKKVITLSLSDLKDLGIIPRKNKKKNKKRKGKKPKYIFVDPNTGAIIGGSKSDSSHMQGYAQSFQAPQFTNTANINSAIQEENLKEIERANRKSQVEEVKQIEEEVKQAEVEQPNQDPNQLLLEFMDDRFGQVVQHNNHLFSGITPFLNRIDNDNQQQKIINQQGFDMIQKLSRPTKYFDPNDNIDLGGNNTSSDNFQDQGRPVPQETNRFQTPVSKRPDTRFDAKLKEIDENETPSGISLSLLKEMKDINKLQGQYDNLIEGTPINIQAVQKNLQQEDVLNQMQNIHSNITSMDNQIKKQSKNMNAKRRDIFGEEDNEEDAGGDMLNDVDSQGKPDYNTPQKQALEDFLKKTKNKNAKYKTSVEKYLKAGGKDTKIIRSNNYEKIERATKKLLKNK